MMSAVDTGEIQNVGSKPNSYQFYQEANQLSSVVKCIFIHLKHDHERARYSKESWSNHNFSFINLTAFYQKSLAQYETGIIRAPNSEVPCLVLYGKLMSELTLETATHPWACAQVSILFYLPLPARLSLLCLPWSICTTRS